MCALPDLISESPFKTTGLHVVLKLQELLSDMFDYSDQDTTEPPVPSTHINTEYFIRALLPEGKQIVPDRGRREQRSSYHHSKGNSSSSSWKWRHFPKKNPLCGSFLIMGEWRNSTKKWSLILNNQQTQCADDSHAGE